MREGCRCGLGAVVALLRRGCRGRDGSSMGGKWKREGDHRGTVLLSLWLALLCFAGPGRRAVTCAWLTVSSRSSNDVPGTLQFLSCAPRLAVSCFRCIDATVRNRRGAATCFAWFRLGVSNAYELLLALFYQSSRSKQHCAQECTGGGEQALHLRPHAARALCASPRCKVCCRVPRSFSSTAERWSRDAVALSSPRTTVTLSPSAAAAAHCRCCSCVRCPFFSCSPRIDGPHCRAR